MPEGRRAQILITGCGGAAGRNINRCIRQLDQFVVVAGCDASPYHLSQSEVDIPFLVPDTTQTDDWINAIDACDADLIWPQPDCDVRALADHSDRFPGKLELPAADVVTLCQCKWATYVHLSHRGVSVPCSGHGEYTDLIRVMDHRGPPIWIRAKHGAGSRASFKAFNVAQAMSWIENRHHALGLEPDDFMASEFLPGREFGCQVLAWHGEIICTQSRERLEYLLSYLSPTGQTSSPSLATMVHEPRVDDVAMRAIFALDDEPHGIYGIDMKENRDGELCVTEVNAGRCFTTSLFPALLGLNFPKMVIDLRAGHRECTNPLLSPCRTDLYWVRGVDKFPRLVPKTVIDGYRERVMPLHMQGTSG